MQNVTCFRSLIFAGALALGSAAQAVPISFEIIGGAGTASGFSVGSQVTVTPSAGLARTFDLEVGQSTGPFNFLDVSVSGAGATVGLIDAVLNFSDPVAASTDGVLAGFSLIMNYFSIGSLTILNDPSPIAFGDGGLFDVDFFGFSSSCRSCSTLNGTVTASVTLLRGPTTSVPEPGTLSLLGAGLLAAALVRRRKRADA